MIRLLLTLLALLTGLVAQTAPAQARMCGVSETEIGAVEGARSGSRTAAGQSSAIDAPVARQERRDREFARVRPASIRIYVPTVQLGIDRAHE
jgi:hypothetical protein